MKSLSEFVWIQHFDDFCRITDRHQNDVDKQDQTRQTLKSKIKRKRKDQKASDSHPVSIKLTAIEDGCTIQSAYGKGETYEKSAYHPSRRVVRFGIP